MPVRLLSNDTIGKIAAGEVVERPASVVKELTENAIDAGATRISVSIAGGGLDRIEVRDDGVGLHGDEIPVALQRHATSKLTTFEDLDRLRTLGFRGEALPSIAAVSQFTVRSRQRGGTAGVEVQSDHGVLQQPRVVAAPVGTTVDVRDLFGNVPARRKFLRQPATESAYIVRTVAAYAAAYPAIAVVLNVDGKAVFGSDGSGDLNAAAAAVFGVGVGAAALSLQPLDDTAAIPGVTVAGWVSEPAVTRSHRHGLVFFVNGRWIHNRALSFALEEAYHSLLMVGRHPVALIWLTLDPATVDVNVHPTKAEVKFLDERAVCRAVQRAAHGALARSPRDDLPSITWRVPGATAPADAPTPEPLRWPGQVLPGAAREGQVVDAAHASGVPILRVLGQVSATFIIAEGPEGLYLVDQHAAHERVLYERILAQLSAQSIDRQPLLDPLIIDLSADEQAVLDRSRTELQELGFEVDSFAEGAIALRAVPAMMRGVDIAERFRAILGELKEGGSGDSWLDAVAISTACHTSIRAGQALSLGEMRELIGDLERSRQPRACGHGRPTMIHLSQYDLEKQFGRR
jgi:DNA mismatch repair protein MutL